MGIIPAREELLPGKPLESWEWAEVEFVCRDSGVEYPEWGSWNEPTVPPWLGSDPTGNVTASHTPTLPSEQEDEAGAEASGISHPTGKGFRRFGHLLGAVVWSRRSGSGNAASLPW